VDNLIQEGVVSARWTCYLERRERKRVDMMMRNSLQIPIVRVPPNTSVSIEEGFPISFPLRKCSSLGSLLQNGCLGSRREVTNFSDASGTSYSPS